MEALYSENNSANNDSNDHDEIPGSPFSQLSNGLPTYCPDQNTLTFQTTTQTFHSSFDPDLFNTFDHKNFVPTSVEAISFDSTTKATSDKNDSPYSLLEDERFRGFSPLLERVNPFLSSPDYDLFDSFDLDKTESVARNHDDISLKSVINSSDDLPVENQITCNESDYENIGENSTEIDSLETPCDVSSRNDHFTHSAIWNPEPFLGNKKIHNRTRGIDEHEITNQDQTSLGQSEQNRRTYSVHGVPLRICSGWSKAATIHGIDATCFPIEPVTERTGNIGDDGLVGQSGGAVDGLIELNHPLDHTNSVEDITTVKPSTETSEAEESHKSMTMPTYVTHVNDRTRETKPEPVLEDSTPIVNREADSENTELNSMLIACQTEEDINNFFENQLNSSMLGIGSNGKRKSPRSHTLEELRDVVVPQLEALLRYHEAMGSNEITIATIRKVLLKRKNNIHGQVSKRKKKKEAASAIYQASITEQDLEKEKKKNEEMRELLIRLTLKPDTEVATSVKKEIHGVLTKSNKLK